MRTMTPGEGNNCSKVPIKALLHKTMESRSPVVWVGKTMHNPTVDPDVSIGVRNPVAKRENQNLRTTVERLPKASHKDKKVSIAKTHMERRVGRNVCLT